MVQGFRYKNSTGDVIASFMYSILETSHVAVVVPKCCRMVQSTLLEKNLIMTTSTIADGIASSSLLLLLVKALSKSPRFQSVVL